MQHQDGFSFQQDNWPRRMSDAAYIGLAGDFVRLVSPESEADPHALLLCFLVGFGAMVGRKPHFLTEATNQGVNEFTVIVGDTARARKGTATDRVTDILKLVNPSFMESQTCYGLATGEGLIYKIRDPRLNGDSLDPGVADKRLLIIESEFSSVLRSIRVSKLSEDLRNAWDGKPIAREIKRGAYSCQRPHVAVIASTTADELIGLLRSGDKANGFGNRFLWCCTRRSKLLPLGGNPLDETRLNALIKGIESALTMAQGVERVTFDSRGSKQWVETAYLQLTREMPGFIGAMTARAETHVIRLALLYALLDSSSVIRMAHLDAALSVWQYCSDSVSYLFGDVLGNEVANRILKILRAASNGVTQTEINRSAFQSNKPAAEMAQALQMLEESRLVRSEMVETAGRPATIWFALERI